MTLPSYSCFVSSTQPRGRNSACCSSATSPKRDAIAERMLRRRTLGADELADLLDHLTLDVDVRHQVARLLGELEASS